MTALLAAGLAGAAVLVARPLPGAALRRLRAAPPRAGSDTASGPDVATGPDVPAVLRTYGPGAAGLVAAVALVTGRGLLAVLVVAAAVALLAPSRRAAAAEAARDATVGRDLPQVAELVASCLHAGAAPVDALDVVCRHVGGPVAAVLQPVTAALRLGIDPDVAWSAPAVRSAPAPVRRLARAMSRASRTGAPLAATVASLAAQERERLRLGAEAAARRAAVRAVGPLGLCFLPAFLLVGVVPVVVAVAGRVLVDVS